MAMQCTVCGQRYPTHAQYCALCGRQLIVSGTSPQTRNVALFVAVVIAGLTTLAVFGAAKLSGMRGGIITPVVTVQRGFDLCDEKASEIHDLIAPKDIKVIVGWREGGVTIQGTPREVETLANFVELITRYNGQSAEEVRAHINQARRLGATTRTYKVAKSKGKVLFRILAGDDVPVLVSGSTRRINVEATPHDQETIRLLVEILRGHRRL